jgi:predicted enzyme related to lactoylglutathione lyase
LEEFVMVEDIGSLMRNDTIMFEYEVHDMKRAVKWYKEILGLKVIFEGGECHTEFALPVKGTRLALSLTEKPRKTGRSPSRLFIVTDDIYTVEAYLKRKNVKVKPIENVSDVVLILWVEDSEGNYFAFEQRKSR